MSKVGAIVLVLMLAGCSSSAGGATVAPSTAPSANGATEGPCIDREQLADSAESVKVAMEGVITALKVGDAAQARSHSETAVSGLNKVADLVAPVTPDAAKTLRDAATKLGETATTFPDGLAQVDEADAAFQAGYQAARERVCAA
jgi:hypothetical protein